MIAYPVELRSPSDLERVLSCVLPAHPHVREIACAVKAYLADDPQQAVPASDDALLQAVRALVAVGETEAAQRVWTTTSAGEVWMDGVDPATLPAETTRLIACGLLRAATSPVLGQGVLAVLDLRTVPVEAPALELIYLPLIHRLVAACIPLWRVSGGQGALVVQGLRQHAGRPSGPGRQRGDPEAWLRRAFQERLDGWAEQEGWPGSPRLVQAS